MSTPKFGEWQPIDTLDRSEIQFVLTYEDGAIRTMLWDSHAGCWEHPYPLYQRALEHTPSFWMPLPEPPDE